MAFFHPQKEVIVESMTIVIGQLLYCTLSRMKALKIWNDVLPTAELAINSVVNHSIRYSLLSWIIVTTPQ